MARRNRPRDTLSEAARRLERGRWPARSDLLSALSDRRPEFVCRQLADQTLKALALKPPAERAEGLRVLLVVLHEHRGCPATLIVELKDLLDELESAREPASLPHPGRRTSDDEPHL